MAWDKDRPYAPFWNDTDVWPERYGSMDSYGNGEDITPEIIDIMYANGAYAPPAYFVDWGDLEPRIRKCLGVATRVAKSDD